MPFSLNIISVNMLLAVYPVFLVAAGLGGKRTATHLSISTLRSFVHTNCYRVLQVENIFFPGFQAFTCLPPQFSNL